MTDFDARVFLALHAALSSNRVVLYVMVALTVIGSGWSILGVLPLLFMRRTRRFGEWMLGTLALTGVAVFAVKHVVMRARPCACLTDVHALVFQAPTDPSFPSGHAAGSFAFAAFLTLAAPIERRRWGIVLFALAGAIGLSRIALAVHFPGDVLAGALLGTAIGTAGARLYLPSGPRRIQTTP